VAEGRRAPSASPAAGWTGLSRRAGLTCCSGRARCLWGTAWLPVAASVSPSESPVCSPREGSDGIGRTVSRRSSHRGAPGQLLVDQGRAEQAALDRIPGAFRQIGGPSVPGRLTTLRRATGAPPPTPAHQTRPRHLAWTTARR
jgi:hypothetical protein